MLTIGVVISPLLSGSVGAWDCRSDLIKDHEQIGAYLRSIIPTGKKVYWDGGLSAAPLLYLPDVEMFPAQINSGYSYRLGGDTYELYQFGLWNEVMDSEWKATADFFIIEEARYTGWMSFFSPELFDEYPRTPIGTSCLEESRLRIFRRR
jgi:hypothetical protein